MTHSEAVAENNIMHTTARLEWTNLLDHFLARLGYRRNQHRVTPGLYALGQPTETSPVFVTANYSLSFDALRSVLVGLDSYILVLDTEGINVWCAAGKGTFGTDEMVRRIDEAQLSGIVSHRRIIVPQLGAPGVSAHEVRRRSGFEVIYGPVRAADLPEFLRTGKATPAMRQVQFGVLDRLVLIPLEAVHALLPLLALLAVSGLLSRKLNVLAIATVLAGTVVFPIVYPYLPTEDFSSKGLVLGFLVIMLLQAWASGGLVQLFQFRQLAAAMPSLLIVPAVIAFLALNFTGSTPFTSKSGVRLEIRRYIPVIGRMVGLGIALILVQSVLKAWR